MSRAHPASTLEQKTQWLLNHKAAFAKAKPEQLPGLCLFLGQEMKKLGLYGPKTTDLDIAFSVSKRVNLLRWVTSGDIKFGYKLSTLRRLTPEECKDLVPSIPPVPARSVRPLKPRIVCICGSSRFIEDIAMCAWEFESQKGMIALGMHLLPAGRGFPAHHAAEAEGPEIAARLDELHLRKIDMADLVFVYNKDGYIGSRTALEINYAHALNKVVDYLNPGMAGR